MLFKKNQENNSQLSVDKVRKTTVIIVLFSDTD